MYTDAQLAAIGGATNYMVEHAQRHDLHLDLADVLTVSEYPGAGMAVVLHTTDRSNSEVDLRILVAQSGELGDVSEIRRSA